MQSGFLRGAYAAACDNQQRIRKQARQTAREKSSVKDAVLFYRNTVKMEKSVFPVRKYREENEDNRKRRREKNSR